MKIERIVVGNLEANCYVISNGAMALIIDPGADAHKIKEYLRVEMLKVDCIVYTHGHADHIAAGIEFDVPMYIFETEERFLKDPKKNLSYFSGHEVQFDRSSQISALKDGDDILFQGKNIKVIHTPGHTPGCICLYYDNVLFSGDTLFYHSVGRTDLPGGSQENIIKSIKEKLFTLPDNTIVYPGHGPETSIGEEKKNNPFIN